MAVFTVHEPPPSGDLMRDAERVTFVRDGFSWAAFLIPLLWLLWHRMWLVLVLWIAIVVIVQWGASLVGEPAPLVAALAIALVMGFEASSLRRWTLERRRFRFAGVVAGTDRSECERRFFADWEGGAPVAPTSGTSAPPATVPRVYASSRHEGDEAQVLGLFPTSERSR
ncbi:DUF2628 domain-containing protein [Pseudoxanthobacter sp. M-2]|uniref:DUF2628 domain-containing protein n=1 Tax=Pseudoxanthobacter sp. M-2 TaxID=3078754 RepID=UPI0038FD299E